MMTYLPVSLYGPVYPRDERLEKLQGLSPVLKLLWCITTSNNASSHQRVDMYTE